MTDPESPITLAREQLNALLGEGSSFERQGFPLGSLELRHRFEDAARGAAPDEGTSAVLARASTTLELARRHWPELRKTLGEIDALRDLGQLAGMDLGRFDALGGDPRSLLLAGPVSAGALEAAQRTANIALATLREALPLYCVRQARAMATWARDARGRGENVADAAEEVDRVVKALDDLDLRAASQAIARARQAIVRISATPSTVAVPATDEAAILAEAHTLARRLPLSEGNHAPRSTPGGDANGGEAGLLTPEDEVEMLWDEVDRLARRRDLAADAAGPAPQPAPTHAESGRAGTEASPAVPLPTEAPSETMIAPISAEAEATESPAPEATMASPPALGIDPVEPRAVPRPEVAPAPAAPPPVPPAVARKASGPAAPDASARIAFSAAYVPPETARAHAGPIRTRRPAARRNRSRHRE